MPQSQTNGKVRLGFVGAGSMGQCAHLRNYVTLPDCEVVALAELRPKTARAVAERYRIPRVYHDHTEMLAGEHLDAIVASQPFGRHGMLLDSLASAGIPVFIEKPLASSVQTGEAILARLAESSCRVMVGYHKRSDPATVYARERILRLKESGELGALKYVRITMPPGDWIAGGFTDLIDEGDPWPELESDPPDQTLDEPARAAHDSFVNYYIHQVNLLRFLLGEPYRVTYADPSGVLLVGESESGVPCTIEMAPYNTTVDWQESALVALERGYVKLHLPAPVALNRPGSVEEFRDSGNGSPPSTLTPQFPWVHAMRQQTVNFISFVKGEAEPPCGAEEALEDLRVAREYIRLRLGK